MKKITVLFLIAILMFVNSSYSLASQVMHQAKNTGYYDGYPLIDVYGNVVGTKQATWNGGGNGVYIFDTTFAIVHRPSVKIGYVTRMTRSNNNSIRIRAIGDFTRSNVTSIQVLRVLEDTAGSQTDANLQRALNLLFGAYLGTSAPPLRKESSFTYISTSEVLVNYSHSARSMGVQYVVYTKINPASGWYTFNIDQRVQYGYTQSNMVQGWVGYLTNRVFGDFYISNVF